MLSHQEDLAPGVGRYTFPNIWLKLHSQIVETINEFYSEQVPEGFYPHFNEVALRQAILTAIPALSALQQQVQDLLTTRYCAIFFDKINLLSFSNSNRNKLLYALSLALGYPTPTDPRQGKLLWNVKSRSVPDGYFATFSEHNGHAELHTDTQYYSEPEEYFLLYVIQAAQCGGGKSILCSGQEVKERLIETSPGREAFEILSTFKFPFRIPTTFTQAGNVGVIETTQATIFDDKPFIRFRHDTIEKGFQCRPDLDVPEARYALEVLLDVLKNKMKVVEYFMPNDALLICNNHTALHGRTSYQDTQRHLIRVRMSTKPLASKLKVLATA